MRRGLLLILFFALAPAAQARTFVVTGHGWGHGVGMSQWGAEGLAEHGWSYDIILAHY
ncbi:MAG: stage sporulation protein, partial [Gaiellaceae bacterium]|nr:stage sporulation protein [Gaiellaceae bacterium]